jgi:hypothetical protein
MCAAPSGRAGAWCLLRDKAGDLQPFANRGPAVRFMAPGDDVADPFAPGRLAHAESSGATAFAVGVVALVLAIHPELRASELDALWMVSTQRIDPRRDLEQAGRDETAASELRPLASDDDGHNAKHGYGRLDATAACLAATDPVAQQLLRMGERAAAQRWGRRAPWAGLLRAATVRALSRHVLIGPARSHPLATLLRHLRLVAQKPDRAAAHAPGSLIRQLALCAGALAASCPAAADELIALEERLRTLSGDSAERERVEEAVTNMVTSAFAPPALGPPRRPAASGHPPQLPA